MLTYIILGHLNPQANRDRTESIKKRDKIWREFEARGMKFLAYNTLGQYDVVTIVEAPSEELALKFFMAAWGTGDVDTTTLRAFTDEEIERARKG